MFSTSTTKTATSIVRKRRPQHQKNDLRHLLPTITAAKVQYHGRNQPHLRT